MLTCAPQEENNIDAIVQPHLQWLNYSKVGDGTVIEQNCIIIARDLLHKFCAVASQYFSCKTVILQLKPHHDFMIIKYMHITCITVSLAFWTMTINTSFNTSFNNMPLMSNSPSECTVHWTTTTELYLQFTWCKQAGNRIQHAQTIRTTFYNLHRFYFFQIAICPGSTLFSLLFFGVTQIRCCMPATSKPCFHIWCGLNVVLWWPFYVIAITEVKHKNNGTLLLTN